VVGAHVADVRGAAPLGGGAALGGAGGCRGAPAIANRLTQLSNLATAFSAGELPALKIMYLSSNRIGGEALADLAAATDDETGVSALHGLSQLWIDRNVIGMQDSAGDTDTEGVGISATRAIARACPGLAVLDVSGNNLRDTHLRALADAIAEGGAFSTRHIESSGPARLRVSLNTCSLAGIRHLQALRGPRCPPRWAFISCCRASTSPPRTTHGLPRPNPFTEASRAHRSSARKRTLISHDDTRGASRHWRGGLNRSVSKWRYGVTSISNRRNAAWAAGLAFLASSQACRAV
jgi:hypothetical protein